MNLDTQEPLQAEEPTVVDPTNEQQDASAIPAGSESAPENKEETKVSFTPEQQKIFDDVVAKKTKATREAEREAERVRAELLEVKAKLPQDARPEIPPMPDQYDDDDYEEKIKVRDQAIANAAAFDTRQADNLKRQEADKKATLQQQYVEIQEKAGNYVKVAESFDLTIDDLKKSANEMTQAGISNDVQNFLLTDEHGPLIADFLSKNFTAMDDLSRMTPMQASVHIATNIKPAVIAARKPTNAPDPADDLSGGGAPAARRGPPGATFE